MKSITYYCLLILVLCFQSCYKEEVIFDSLPNEELELVLILELNGKDCFFDYSTNSLRYSIEQDSIQNFAPYVRFQDYSEIYFNNIPLTNKTINNLGKIKLKEEYSVRIITKGVTTNLTLTFTNLPIVRIVTPNEIIDDPQKLARFTINYPSVAKSEMTSFIGVEIRGGSSLYKPKRSYGFSFLNSMGIKSKTSKALFGWKEKEDWILNASYNDQSRVRNKISFEVWEAMNPLTHQFIQSKFVELYVNNDCQGLYCLNEQMNAEQLGLTGLEAVLYKGTAWGDGATTFEHLLSNMPLFTDEWDGWEQKHPRPNDQINWQPLYDLRDLVVNKSDATFIGTIPSQIDFDICIDYYIFLNLISGIDNTGKNMFWVRENTSAPFFIAPWDLDATWGRFWDGFDMNSTTIATNKLFDRLLTLNPNNFKGNLKNRWLVLRADVLAFSNLERIFENNFSTIKKSDILDIENLKWGTTIDALQEQHYINSWTLDHLAFLDVYFANL